MKLILLLGIILLTTGCSGVRIFATPPEEPIIIHPPPPPAVVMRDVEWTVYNRERLEELLENAAPGEEIVLITLTPRGYENLSLNIADVLRYVREQKEIILYYRRLFPKGLEEETTEGE